MFAHVLNNMVTTVIVADQEFIDAPHDAHFQAMFTGQWVACDATVAPGDSYSAGTFSRPAAPQMPRQPITKIEYLRRFTQTERVAIRLAAAANHIVNDYIELLDATTTLHLDDPDVIAGVQSLESASLLGQGRAAEILA